MDICLESNSISVGYGKEKILDEVSFKIFKKDLVCLIGSNGSGKTSLIKSIIGIEKPITGSFSFGKNILISVVPQFKKIQYHYPITVEKFLFLNEKFSFQKKNLFQFRVLSELGILDYKNKLIRECSGGQIQKVLIARSILSEANLIFFDEPLDAIDENSKQKILQIFLEESNSLNRTFFIISHNLEFSFLKHFNRKFKVEDKKVIEFW